MILSLACWTENVKSKKVLMMENLQVALRRIEVSHDNAVN